MLREPSSEYSSNCDEAMFGVEKYSPISANLASDWLRAESSPVEIKIKMDDGVETSLASEGTDLFGRHSLVSGTQYDIVVN